jgi:CheY-like chemotaxis protein
MSQTILVVEDDAVARTGLVTILLNHGYDPLTAADGWEALDQLHRGPQPDLILLDMILPRCDGWRFLAETRKDSGLAEIPVVVMTGLGIASDEWARSLRAVALLHKPLNVVTLLDTVRRYAGAG